MASVRIEDIEWRMGNEAHVTRHGISAEEIHQVFNNNPVFKRNKRGRVSDFVAIGVTNGGKKVRVNFVYDPEGRAAKPISAWEV